MQGCWNLLVALMMILPSMQAWSQVQERLGTPNILLGKTGAAGPASVDSASVNPAQAGAMQYTEVQGSWGFKSEDYLQRYPGFEAHTSSTSGLDSFPMPGFIWKLNSKLGLGGFAVPFPVKQEIDKKRIPIIILSQQDYVDLKGSGSLLGLAAFTAGYSVNKNFHVGASFSYISIEGAVDLVPSAGGEALANVETTASFTSVKLGAKVKIARPITLGLVVGALDMTSTTFNVTSPLTGGLGGDAAAAPPGGDTVESSTFMNPIRGGIAFQPNAKFMLTGDVEYSRVEKGKQAFSLVDLTMKEREVADTISVYGGSEIRMTRTGKLLIGGLYEPPSIGQGSPGPTGLSGFGFMDIAQNIGEPPTRPQWMIGGGYRWEMGEIYPRGTKDKDKEDKKPDPRMFVEAGLMYGETSIGIDENGEQPGAYLVKRYKVPFKFIYRF